MTRFGRDARAALVSHDDLVVHADWLGVLDATLAAAGGLDGAGPSTPEVPARMASATPYVYDKVPRRDERFPDPFNMSVNAEAFIWDAAYPPAPKLVMLFYKRLREIDVPEMMASIIAETPGKPWGYYHDMSRQLWDEARHAMMGEVGFAAIGLDWPSLVRINFTWSRGLNTQLTAIERHAVLYFIEQGLMPKTGKRYEWEVGRADRPSACADVPGLRLGRRGTARADRPAVVCHGHADARRGAAVRRPVLVQGAGRLGCLASRRPDRTRELVAGRVQGFLRTTRRNARSGRRGVCGQL